MNNKLLYVAHVLLVFWNEQKVTCYLHRSMFSVSQTSYRAVFPPTYIKKKKYELVKLTSGVSWTPRRPLRALAFTQNEHWHSTCLCVYSIIMSAHTCLPSYRVNLRAKRSSSWGQFGWWTHSFSHLVSEGCRHSTVQHSLMFLINQCHWPLMELQLLLPVRQCIPVGSDSNAFTL